MQRFDDVREELFGTDFCEKYGDVILESWPVYKEIGLMANITYDWDLEFKVDGSIL
jgi:hypothetical protein